MESLGATFSRGRWGVEFLTAGLILLVVTLLTACGSTIPAGASSSPVITPTAPQESSATATTPTETLPTPGADGGYYHLTFDQAQQLTPITLIQPTYIPPSLDKDRLTIIIPPVPPVGSSGGKPTGASLFYPAATNRAWNVDIEETGLPMTIPGSAGNPATVTSTGAVSTVKIDGIMVTRIDTLDSNSRTISSFYWKQGSTTMILTALIGQPVSEPEIEQMIGSMIGQE